MRTLRTLFFFTALFLLFLLFLFRAPVALTGAKQGLSLFFEVLFPALFPFLVLSELVLSCGVGEALGRLFYRPLGFLFGVSKVGSGALVLGALCGQPVASSAAASLHAQGVIGKEEVERISLFANNPSSPFLVAAVGGALFGSTAAGVALFAITQLSAAILGTGFRIFFGKAEKTTEKCQNGTDKRPFSALFTTAVQRGFSCILQVGSFLIFFSALSAVLSDLLAALQLDPTWHAWIFGCLEITAGIRSAVSVLDAYSAFRLAAFLCGFGGICVCMQILSITQECAISAWKYLLAKLFQGGIALLLCEGYLRLFQPVLAPAKALPTLALPAHLPVLGGLILAPLLGLLWQKKKERASKSRSFHTN